MQVEGHFAMHRGGYLESPTIAYETWGKLNDTPPAVFLSDYRVRTSGWAKSTGDRHTR